MDLIRENWDSGYVFNGGIMQDFFSVFAVYFPAGIGILAGANISGDLKVTLLFKNDLWLVKIGLWLQVSKYFSFRIQAPLYQKEQFGLLFQQGLAGLASITVQIN